MSTGEGLIFDHTYEELLQLDFGIKHSEYFKGLKIVTFEEILQKFSCHVVMNIHIKTRSFQSDYDPAHLQKIIDLIDKYDCRRYVYFTCGNDNVLQLAREFLAQGVDTILTNNYHLVSQAVK